MKLQYSKKTVKFIAVIFLFLQGCFVNAQVSLPNVFGDHMVLQRNQENPIWGKASRNESITVSIGNQKHKIVANNNGDWRVKLNPVKAGGPYTLTVKGKNVVVINDILFGEVWVCAGQSNMAFSLIKANNSEVEIASANYPEIRLLRVPIKGGVNLEEDFNAKWETCTPETVKKFSALGYLYGRRIHNTIGVPVGLINTAWGSSALETWIPRDAMDKTDEYSVLLNNWDKAIAEFSDKKLVANKKKYKAWLEAGKPGKRMSPARDIRTNQKRPANAFNAMINPIVGYGIKGVIWYQGEANVGRAYQHRKMFPLLINTWRSLWKQNDFSFYWSQLADFNFELDHPQESLWAELRESQTMSLSVPNTGEAVIFDLGESTDIHPRNKQFVASRLVRHALAKDYGIDMQTESPRYASKEIRGNKIVISFDNIEKGLYAFDSKKVKGFAIAGQDRKFVWAEAKIIAKNKVEVYSKDVINPVAVRYGWANNPVLNLYDKNTLPVTGFRTDSWPGLTYGKEKAVINDN